MSLFILGYKSRNAILGSLDILSGYLE